MSRSRALPPAAVAIVSAVALESARLQQQLTPVATSPDLPLWRGVLAGRQVLLTLSGVGKANAARACALLLERHQPCSVALIGCGGAYPGSDLRPGDLALADYELFGDEGVMTSQGFLDLEQLALPLHCAADTTVYNQLPCSDELTRQLRPVLQQFAAEHQRRLRCGGFVTVSCCTGSDRLARELADRTGGLCENMEGAAVALCCLKLGVPFVELRGISNRVEERDPARWDLPGAAAIAQDALLATLASWPAGHRP